MKRTANLADDFRGTQRWVCFPGGSNETELAASPKQQATTQEGGGDSIPVHGLPM